MFTYIETPAPPETGSGKYVFEDGAIYGAHTLCVIFILIEGEWMSVDGAIQRHGKGTYSYGNNVYTGEWANDHMSGEGSIICILFSFSQEL